MFIPCALCGNPSDHRAKSGLCRSCFELHKPDSTANRFWAKVIKTPGCWKWAAKRYHRFGYGVLATPKSKWGRTQIEAHRVSWVLHFGQVPEGLSVLHRCDNPECTRPDHLFLGTTADNLADMRRKGREASGDRHGSKTHPESFPGRAQNFRNHPPRHVLNAQKQRSRTRILGTE